MKQQAPYSIQIELSLGCNLACSFCGINNVEIKERRFLTPAIATAIGKGIADAGWNSRIEFAMRGEPSLNPHLNEVIAALRAELPKNSMMMLTNGAGFIKSPIASVIGILKAGLNTLAIEQYGQINYAQRIQASLEKTVSFGEGKDVPVQFYPVDPKGNPHTRFHKQRVVFIADIAQTTIGTHKSPNNHGGYAGELVAYDKPCAKPFREMSINWNGNVNHCCVAWAGEMRCGNVLETPIDDIWNNERFFAVRQKLMRGERDFSVCKGCDQKSFRVGLLPDILGKRKDMYPPPTAETERIIKMMDDEGSEIPRTQVYWERNAKEL